MDIILKDGLQYIRYKKGRANIAFFTAYNNANFNMLHPNFQEEMDKVQSLFNLKELGYSKQIHSDIINTYDGIVKFGDALVTDKKQIGIGIFTADCVPVLIYDNKKEICAAVHSGWKGTYSRLVFDTIKRMVEDYQCYPKDIEVYIGPHIRECCYEVGQDLVEKFSHQDIYKGYEVVRNRYLNMALCIKLQCVAAGVGEERINDVNLCTCCSNKKSNIKLHSYRKMKDKSGRLFSLIYVGD